ncbi:MAG: hypothetical protein KDA57_03940 [Planctomycetales bacterium]|nr:hypothetical protein [Planctomycetales bacterium]
MRYLVEATVKPGCEHSLLSAIDNGTLGRGSVAGGEYLRNMATARISEEGVVSWVEVCYCCEPLQEERPYWETHFDLLRVRNAHARKNCRHENGIEPRACEQCDCTAKLEERLAAQGQRFIDALREKLLRPED